ncbi:Site-specific recombinase XerD [Variovorax sp. HW608]|jgi:site-specific recombinase XerD|uniref:tyrosine-type recombinase/integrase n=1 Tax=Variovorax sp. HW608 TaxID=1034889 RepID=UPI00081FAD57|nr:tyrosine-type recombinase/integrase [Variovorax sp. HW608]SCK08121.1 Site-specific recombinase XerD [Variovorax sp. HW608]SCK11412.1 Site-specific recombinase XerD [Variovorax sp. HW608]SCK31552.1 Site-specific recombinase XerD [Variovorax sp. HW608]SCK37614.1 Site-specific recombinase XerD [Variovorax sp. HW608]
MKPVDPFPALLHAFFYERLVQQRNASVHTIRSYRDAWRLFLRFVAAHRHCRVTDLTLPALSAGEVAAFLQYSECDRKVSIGTRNCRLAALHSFFAFVAEREPAAVAQCAEVLRIPTKKAPRPAHRDLELHEIEAILAQPDRGRLEGQRDHALLWFLYNTGARIQEALDVRVADVRFDTPRCVRLFGKGRKERICPLWPETVDLLSALLERQPRTGDELLFVNRYGAPLGASGVRFKLAQYVRAATQVMPTLALKKVSPHAFRHAAAVHLLAAGVDVAVIRSWLGHASLETTYHYAQANLDTKREALERLQPPPTKKSAPWRRDASLLAWLESL